MVNPFIGRKENYPVNEVKIRVKVQLRMLAKDWAQDLFTVQRIHLDDSNSVFFNSSSPQNPSLEPKPRPKFNLHHVNATS